ncbi:procollagen galactosyltransferase 1-A-like isoform X2 [Gigantopelta aegis]|nr:procollagen galactosyltransferase 1-A-like isoform X2 [Gigantopelta aegis]
MERHYHHVDVQYDEERRGYDHERCPLEWTEKRFDNVIQLRQQALDHARNAWSDYLFMLDTDVILHHKDTLQILMGHQKTVIGPMLNISTEGAYSNFWCGMTDEGFYKRVPEYMPIVLREKMGCFPVPMVHSAVFINLRHRNSSKLSYLPPSDYEGPVDDIIIFAHRVREAGMSMYVTNEMYFGTVQIPLDYPYTLHDEVEFFKHTKLEAMLEGPPLYVSPHVYVPPIPQDKLGLDEVYMINLLRRPERRFRMKHNLYELGIDAKIIDAVDGQELNDTYLDSLNVDMLPGYSDPYNGRALTMGEIGCFLSHYFLWQEMISKNLKRVLFFEDDVRFEPQFRHKLQKMLHEADTYIPQWELIYLGRKRLRPSEEAMIQGTNTLCWPHYSYWTLSYLLTLDGARKLIAQNPLVKMLPVDEYLPIMFNKHPEKSWKQYFSPRNLVGISAEPLLVYPTHYTGEPNYVSDTEDSSVIPLEDQLDFGFSDIKDEL